MSSTMKMVGERCVVARAFSVLQTRGKIADVDCLYTQTYASKYEMRFILGIDKLALGMTSD